jgi:hypothetical protein
MANDRGRNIPLSLSRRMVGDVLAVSQQIPLANGERRIDLSSLRAAVAATRPRPAWLPLVFKAYSIAAPARPALRRLYVPRPWPHLYEHLENVGTVVISRKMNGEDTLFGLPIVTPENRPIREIEKLIAEARERPVAEIPAFRRQLRLARFPGPLRRFIYGWGMNWAGRFRVRLLGTFAMSVLASMGAATISTWVPQTTMIHYTPFDESGSMFLRIVLDHRVFDGLEGAYALRETEEVLNTQILEEVKAMGRSKAA